MKEIHQRRDGFHAAQEMDDRGEHGQVDEDLQPQARWAAAAGSGCFSPRGASPGNRRWPGPARRQPPAARRPKPDAVVQKPRAGRRSHQRQGEHRRDHQPPQLAEPLGVVQQERTIGRFSCRGDSASPGRPGAGRRRPASQWRLRWSKTFPLAVGWADGHHATHGRRRSHRPQPCPWWVFAAYSTTPSFGDFHATFNRPARSCRCAATAAGRRGRARRSLR